jgi:hypothetical protein
MTFEQIALKHQKKAGILNQNNVLSIRGLTSENSVPVVQSKGQTGLVTLIDGNFTGGSASESAIDNQGALYARNLKTSGYQSAIKDVPGTYQSEFVSQAAMSLFPSAQSSLRLPVEDTPEFHDSNLGNWASVTEFGATPNDGVNDTEAIQAAIDSGKSTIYFPTGYYRVSDTIHVRGNVAKLVGMQSRIESYQETPFNNPNEEKPYLRIEKTNANAVIIDHLNTGGRLDDGAIGVEHASPKAVVIKDSSSVGKLPYRNTEGAGKLFLENVDSGNWRFDHPQSIWARQMNPENRGLKIENKGAKLWILGLKTEKPGTVIETTAGGQTELLGGLIYPTRPVPADQPAFVSRESKESLIYATTAYGSSSNNYDIQVQETRDGVTRNLLRSDLPSRTHYGAVVPLQVGH